MSTFSQNSQDKPPREDTATVFKIVTGHDKFTANDRQATVKYIVENGQHINCLPDRIVTNIDVAIPKVDTTYRRITPKTYGHIEPRQAHMVGFILLNYRDNELYIINGANRLAAAIANSITAVPAIIFTGLTESDEAKAFLADKRPRPIRPLEEFQASLKTNDPVSIDIKTICEKYAITIGSANGIGDYDQSTRVLANLRIAREIVTKGDIEALDWILGLLSESRWADEPNGINAKSMNALLQIYIDTEDLGTLDEFYERLLDTLSKVTAREFTRAAENIYPHEETRVAVQKLMIDVTHNRTSVTTIKHAAHQNPLIN